MAMKDPASNLDFYDPGFLADPYPALGRVREATPIFRNEQTGQWMLTRFGDVYETLRDRRLGRVYHHMYNARRVGTAGARPALGRIPPARALVAAEPGTARPHPHPEAGLQGVHLPLGDRADAGDRRAVRRALIDRCREMGTFDLLADYAQRYSVAVVGEVLGVPRADTQRLLDWSHAIVKMYELSDVRRTEGAGRRGGGRVHRLHARVDRRQAPLTRRPPGLAARADLRRRRPAQRRRDRVHHDGAAGGGSRGHGQHHGQRHEGAAGASRPVAAPGRRRGGRGDGGRGAAALGLPAADVHPLGTAARRGNRRSDAGRGRGSGDAVRLGAARPAPVRPSQTASTWRAATPPTSASAAASTSASAPLWPATSWPSPWPTWWPTFPTWNWPPNRSTTPPS